MSETSIWNHTHDCQVLFSLFPILEFQESYQYLQITDAENSSKPGISCISQLIPETISLVYLALRI